jgi:hypothetical protein
VLEHMPAGIRPLREVYDLIAQRLIEKHSPASAER